jgi:superfamily I DNA/RNA helicase
MKKVIKLNQQQINRMVKKVIKEETDQSSYKDLEWPLWNEENNLTEEEKQKLANLHNKYINNFDSKIGAVYELFRNSDEVKEYMELVEEMQYLQDSWSNSDDDYENHAYSVLDDILDEMHSTASSIWYDY